VFFGAYDPTAPAIGLGETLMRRMPAAAKTLPAGDFRDWDAIESWAAEIATALAGTVA
jgi:menaquinone-dependent protoporphyrinogen oxidase